MNQFNPSTGGTFGAQALPSNDDAFAGLLSMLANKNQSSQQQGGGGLGGLSVGQLGQFAQLLGEGGFGEDGSFGQGMPAAGDGEIDPVTGKKTTGQKIGSAATGALSGAATGAQFGGPIGAGIGAAVGGLGGFFG